MSDSQHKSIGRPRSVKSHQAMLQATLELLAEVGFERMTMDAIAMRAKIGKNTIYRRYTCKEELVADAIETCDRMWLFQIQVTCGQISIY